MKRHGHNQVYISKLNIIKQGIEYIIEGGLIYAALSAPTDFVDNVFVVDHSDSMAVQTQFILYQLELEDYDKEDWYSNRISLSGNYVNLDIGFGEISEAKLESFLEELVAYWESLQKNVVDRLSIFSKIMFNHNP